MTPCVRRLLPAVSVLAATACTPTYKASDIEGTDLMSRYPRALRVARHGLVVEAAVALVASTAWLPAGRFPQGPIYRVAADGAFWLGPAAIAAGVVWLVIFTTSVGLWIGQLDC